MESFGIFYNILEIFGVLEFWILELWSVGALIWSFGVWSFGVLEFWSFEPVWGNWGGPLGPLVVDYFLLWIGLFLALGRPGPVWEIGVGPWDPWF